MTEPKEFNPLDELYKNTFQNLSQTPAVSGWDTPSDRVWNNVATQINTPRSGWSGTTIALLSAIALIVAAGLYFAFGRTTPAQPGPASPVVQPATAVPAVVDETAPLPANMPSKTAVSPTVTKPTREIHHNAAKTTKNTDTPAVNSTQPKNGSSRQLPGSPNTPPNSTEGSKKPDKVRQ